MNLNNDAEIKALEEGVRAAKYEVHLKKGAKKMNIAGGVDAAGNADALAYLATRAAALVLDNYVKAAHEDAVSREELVDALIGMVETHLEALAREAEEGDADDQN